MSAHVLLNLLKRLGEKIRCEAVPSTLSVFPNKFTGVQIQDSVYDISKLEKRRDVFMNVNA